MEIEILEVSGQATAHRRVFVVPEGLETRAMRERFPDSTFASIDPAHLTGVRSYNLWLTSSDFYRMWRDYDWILVSQLDALLRSDPWEVLGSPSPPWDYLGAPWDPPMRVVTRGSRILVRSPSGDDRGPAWAGIMGRKLHVGNGGLSLRRQAAFEEAATKLERDLSDATREHIHEDVVWAAFGPRYGVTSAPEDTAACAFWETTEPQTLGIDGVPRVPGYHGVDRWSDQVQRQVLAEAGSSRSSANGRGGPQ
jgi:hypothetical protein